MIWQKAIICSLPRCLKKPLDKLFISNCQLSQSDLDYLPYCWNIFELRYLCLSVHLRNLFLVPLAFLLERVRHTLECLILKSCDMGESQFNALLPVLSQCSHLTEVNFHDNELSLLFLKQLLHHTANLSQLTNEVYPSPLECYDNREVILTQRLENFCPELLDILRAKRQPKKFAFATSQCSVMGPMFTIWSPNVAVLKRTTERVIVEWKNGSLVLRVDETLSECPLLKGAWICQSPKGLRHIRQARSSSEQVNGCCIYRKYQALFSPLGLS